MHIQEAPTISWDSPYQDEAYFLASSKAGFPCLVHNFGLQTVFFYKAEEKYIAWELPKLIFDQEIPIGLEMQFLSQVVNYSDYDWSDDRVGYATVFSQKKDLEDRDSNNIPTSYSKRFRRSLKRALESPIQYQLAETQSQVKGALKLFKDFPERRNNLEFNFFQSVVAIWLMADVADLHTIWDPIQRSEVASAVVLKSKTQANLRYYTAERSSENPGHLLHHSLLDYYLNTQSFNIVDQSGISSPKELTEEAKGINEFKLQTTQRVALFRNK